MNLSRWFQRPTHTYGREICLEVISAKLKIPLRLLIRVSNIGQICIFFQYLCLHDADCLLMVHWTLSTGRYSLQDIFTLSLKEWKISVSCSELIPTQTDSKFPKNCSTITDKWSWGGHNYMDACPQTVSGFLIWTQSCSYGAFKCCQNNVFPTGKIHPDVLRESVCPSVAEFSSRTTSSTVWGARTCSIKPTVCEDILEAAWHHGRCCLQC